MGLGYSSNQTDSRAFIIGGLVAGFIIGFLASGFLAGGAGNSDGLVFGSRFNEADRNFLVDLANNQVNLTALRLAPGLDWCTASGGQWNVTRQQGQVNVSEEIARQLGQSGADVTQTENGWVANVAVLTRDQCIFPIAKGG